MELRENETLVRSKFIPIKPFRTIKVGDPSYFERLEAVGDSFRTTRTLKELTLDTKVSCVKGGGVLISETHEDYRGIPIDSIVLDVALSLRPLTEDAGKSMAMNYLAGRYYEHTVKNSHRLGCDTACFAIDVDGNGTEIRTGSDGQYGYALEMKQYFGFTMELTFDKDLFSFEEVESIAKSLWQEDETIPAEEVQRIEEELVSHIKSGKPFDAEMYEEDLER